VRVNFCLKLSPHEGDDLGQAATLPMVWNGNSYTLRLAQNETEDKPTRMQIRPPRHRIAATLTVVLVAVCHLPAGECVSASGDRPSGHDRVCWQSRKQHVRPVDLVLRGVQERMQTAYGSDLELDSDAVRLR
jgi:hypothetical protein